MKRVFEKTLPKDLEPFDEFIVTSFENYTIVDLEEGAILFHDEKIKREFILKPGTSIVLMYLKNDTWELKTINGNILVPL